MFKSKELSEFDRGSIVGCHPVSSKVHQELVLAAGLSSSRVKKTWDSYDRAAAHKSNITPQNPKHRLQCCRAHRHWTVDMWKTVLWSDESRFTVWKSDGRVWVWRMPGECFFSDYIVPTVKFGGGKHNGVGVSRGLAWKHLWDELESRLRSQPNRPSSLQASHFSCEGRLEGNSYGHLSKLVESLPKRMQAVIHAKGGPTP
ncbi:QLQ domain-containing protein [Trichonephila clavipes]|nr:QLQ domain-containing protein [Trichonephila clavipes]